MEDHYNGAENPHDKIFTRGKPRDLSPMEYLNRSYTALFGLSVTNDTCRVNPEFRLALRDFKKGLDGLRAEDFG